MTSKARSLVQTVLTRFYREHHNKQMFEDELVDEVNSGHVGGFSQCKRRVVEALDHRLATLSSEAELTSDLSKACEIGAQITELTKLRMYVKGMVIKVDEDQS